jgi:exopolysaccharide biosynthesis polyprenyl glycosylphosphotransferase
MDLLCLAAGSAIAMAIRLPADEIPSYVFDHTEGWLLFFGGILLANFLAGSYRIQYIFSRFNLVVTWVFSLLFVFLILSVTTYAWLQFVLGRGVLLLSVVFYSVLVLVLKLLVYRRLFRSDRLTCRVLILGAGKCAREMAAILENEFVLPAHRVVGFVELDGERTTASAETCTAAAPVVRASDREVAGVVSRADDVNLVVVAPDDPALTRRLYPVLFRLRFEGVEVMFPLQVAEVYSGSMPLEMLNDELVMDASLETGFPLVHQSKRLMDIVASLIAIGVLWPLALIVAAVMKVADWRSPVFYRQERSGQFGTPFTILKFRTMSTGAEQGTGAVWAAEGDPRVTAIGRVLRRFRIDEIPQFINVLKGEMSLVGPRPERPEIVERLVGRIPFYAERMNVPPGLTGWAQVRYPYGNTIEDARRKLEYDLFYIKHLSLPLDLQILLSTLRIVFGGRPPCMPSRAHPKSPSGNLVEP